MARCGLVSPPQRLQAPPRQSPPLSAHLKGPPVPESILTLSLEITTPTNNNLLPILSLPKTKRLPWNPVTTVAPLPSPKLTRTI